MVVTNIFFLASYIDVTQHLSLRVRLNVSQHMQNVSSRRPGSQGPVSHVSLGVEGGETPFMRLICCHFKVL